MKVLYVIDNLQKGGKERRLFELLRFWETNFDVNSELVLLRDKIEYTDVHKLSRTKVVVLKRKIKKDPFVFFRLFRKCITDKPDIIHTWGSQPAVYMCLIAFILRIPFCNSIIVNAKCQRFSKDWIRSRISFPFSTRIFANSFAGLKAYGVTDKRGVVIYNGFNFDRNNHLTNQDRLKEQLGVKSDFVVGMVGSFHPRKDFQTLIKAAAEIHKTKPEIFFLCVGEGDKYLEVKNLSNQIDPHPENVLFPGKRDDVESIIQLFNIGVLVTNTQIHQEGISNSIMEYMSQQKPVIATSGGGTNEIVKHGETGLIIDAFNVKKLSAAIMELYQNKALREKYGAMGLARIKEMFSIDQMTRKTHTCYTEIVKK